MYEELIRVLRHCGNPNVSCKGCSDEDDCIGSDGAWEIGAMANMRDAAQAIEELVKDLERSKEYETFWHEEAEEALRKLQRILLIIDNKHCWIIGPYMGDVITHWEPSIEPPKEET